MNRRAIWLIAGGSSATVMITLCWATATYGVGASPDTVTYLSVAQNVLKGKGFFSYDGAAMVEFPPLYPLLISIALYLLPVPALSAVKVLSVLIAGGCTGVAASLLQHGLRYPVVQTAGLALLLLSVPLWSVYVMGWSEPPFIFFTLLLFVVLARYLHAPSTKWMLCTAGASSLCMLTRYTGVVAVVTGALGIGWAPSSCKRTRFRHVIQYSLLVFGIFGVWLIRNLIVSGTLMGERVPSERGLLQNLDTCRHVLDGWFFPGAAIPIALLLLAWTAVMFTQASRPSPSSTAFQEKYRLQVLLAFYVVAYLALLVLSASRVAYDELDNRLLAPVYVPLLLALLGIGELVFSRLLSKPAIQALVAIPLILFVLPPASSTRELLTEVHEEGADFTSARWWKSPALAFLRQHELDAPLYSNCPEAIYLHTGKTAALLPRRFYYATHLPVREDIRDFVAEVKETGSAYVLWFLSEPTRYLYSPQQLASWVALRLERHFSDADLFRVASRTGSLAEEKP